MKVFLTIFAAFWVAWLLWYLTGGPLRTTNKYPLVKYNDPKGFSYATSSKQKD